ncbi:hypothetical protein C6P40_002678 [Pichia californica]|uniref:Xaa-Pro aminopeptidase n=1 Tax=Pichia californica TaxID=460514 RepID=A0A9P6WQ98_9ASCO|nr:hypothetical protein C6P40_002678 [[Candida] californica]
MSAVTNASSMAKPSMFSLITQNGIAGATTINDASQGHNNKLNSSNGGNSRCNNCTCSPGLLSRNNRRSSLYLRRMMSTSSNSNLHSHSHNNRHGIPSLNSNSNPSSPKKSFITEEPSLLSSPVSSPNLLDDSCNNILTPNEHNTSLRLEKLRNLMKDLDLGIYIIPSEDEHQSEYTSIVDQRRSFISGFSGSAGIAIITREISSMNEKPEGLAFLATDGRYFTQATNELDFNWNLIKLNNDSNSLSWEQCTIDNAALLSLDSGKLVNIGIDPKLITFNEINYLNNLINKKIEENNKLKIKLIPIRDNLIDKIWNEFEEKPIRKFNKIFKLDDKFTGESTLSKLNRLNLNYFKKLNINTMILNSLDEISWLLNLRGNDIDYNPLFYSYLIINDSNNLILYTNNHERFSNDLKNYLIEINCKLKFYDEIWFDIRKISSNLKIENKKLLLTNDANWKMINCIIGKNFIQIESPIKLMKEIKNSIELNGQIKAQIDDGYALIKFFSWLENQLIKKCEFITEFDASMKLLEIRKELNNFKGLSFETISSTGSNSAIIHYSPPKFGSELIDPNKIYLCDSGSQFLNGTTDTTRTLHFSEPSNEEIENYTLVLKGHIALSNLIIPNNHVTGFQIDCIARQFLWNKGLDYSHGTGHGVDSFGPVHSSGVGIGFRDYCNKNKLQKGNLISNEPGYYKPNCYGIRIENMVYLKEISENSNYLKFETTTKVPYCKKLININLLTNIEKKWINDYHESIWKLYENKFEKKSWEWNWLKRETSPL